MADLEHGNYLKYNRGCRCAECKSAWAQYSKDRRKARAEAGSIPLHVHGSVNGYANYSCRCARCSQAASEAYRAHRHPDLDEKVREARLDGYRDGLEEGKRIGEKKATDAAYLDGHRDGYKEALEVLN